ncbi:unnamed protein product, partial [Amoebophrya sp. A25]
FGLRRWKEEVYVWAYALVKLGATTTMLGTSLMSKAFEDHEGEFALIGKASRDLVDIMGEIEDHFAPYVQGIREKAELYIPQIRREDGQDVNVFLSLLGIVFARLDQICEDSKKTD